MATFKKIDFKRNYEMTCIKFVQVSDSETLDSKEWIECDESEIDCNQLYKQANKTFFGYM